MKTVRALLTLSLVFLIPGCASLMGLPLGLGPGWDELVGVAIVGLIAARAYWPIRKFSSTYRRATNSVSPLDITRERYARGEINHEEYERMKQHLS